MRSIIPRLRVSNAIAIETLFGLDYAFRRMAGRRAWVVEILIALVGSSLDELTMALKR